MGVGFVMLIWGWPVCRVPGWGGDTASVCCFWDGLLVMTGGGVSTAGCSVVPSLWMGFSARPAPDVSVPVFSSSGSFESVLLDSATVGSCFLIGVD